MQFKEIPGQSHTAEQLMEMIHQNRLSHALLFLGKEGSGALPLAIAFAQFILCKKGNGNAAATQAASLFGEPEPVVEEKLLDACGTCPSCIKIQQLIHPDLHFTFPVIPKKAGEKPTSKDYITEWRSFIAQTPYGNAYDWLQQIGAENKQGNITAAECSEIIRTMNLKSYEGDYKILILWMPEYLDKEGNKLLKLIEEPPANTLFILVAENESQILPTILSRCQLVKIPVMEHAAIAHTIAERSGLSSDQAAQLAAIADGNLREALQLLEHADDDWLSYIREWLNAILKNGPVAQVKWVEEVNKLGREKQKQLLRYFNHLIEQALRVGIYEAAGQGNQINLPQQELEFARKLNQFVEPAQQEAIIKELDKATYYIERNANAKILFQALTLKLYHIIANKSLILIQ
jgi:DNA polymerase-3 subunit delta'